MFKRAENIPDFKTIEEFVLWYFDVGMPFLLPPITEVFLSDDATSSCLFRYKQFQVELYMIHPNPLIPIHEHPDVENVEIPSSLWASFTKEDIANHLQKNGQSHGNSFKERAKSTGFLLLSFQKWKDGLEVTTIASKWKGHTAGQKHESLIRRFNPDALVINGYADTSSKQVKEEIL